MSIYKSINIEYNCEKCNAHNEFNDDLKISGMRQEKCKNFDFKFIKTVDDDNKTVEYNCSFKCKNCKKNGNLLFDLDKNKKEGYEPITKIYECCDAKLIINGLLLLNDEDEIIDEKNKYNVKTQIIKDNNAFNNNINNINQPINQFHINSNQNLNNFNNFGGGNNNNQFMANSVNNINYMNLMNNNGFNMNNNIPNSNNGFNGMNVPNMNYQPQNNQIHFGNFNNNFMGMNPQVNNINNMMNNLNLNDQMNNNRMPQSKSSIKANIQFGEKNNITIKRDIPFNKRIIDVLREIEEEKPEVKEYNDNIRDNIIMCGGDFVDCSKTIEELKKENGIYLKDNCILVVPEKEKSVYINY